MLRIGITGGIGSGKTLVCNVFETLKIPVYYTDLRTKAIQLYNKEVISGIKDLFGEEAYSSSTQLNREFIAGQVFNNKEKLAQLNALVHPKVFEDFENWCTEQKNKAYILKESALTFETGFNKKLDKVIVVTAPESLRISRVLERDKFRSKTDIENIIERQMPEAEKIKLADFVLANDEAELLVPKILELDKIFKDLAAHKKSVEQPD